MAYSVLAQYPEMRGEFLTDYWYLSVLPGFRWASFRVDRSDIHVSTPFYSAVTQKMLSLDGLSYLLLSNCIPESVQAVVDARIADGSYTVLGTYRSEKEFIPYFEGSSRRSTLHENQSARASRPRRRAHDHPPAHRKSGVSPRKPQVSRLAQR